MKLGLRSVSIGAAAAAVACIMLIPAASAMAVTAASQGTASAAAQPAKLGPSTESLITSWGQSFAQDRPNSVTNYPADLLPARGGTSTISDIAPGHIACVSFQLDLSWPTRSVPGSTAQISAAVADQASVVFTRNAAGQIVGEFYVGSSTCQVPTPTTP